MHNPHRAWRPLFTGQAAERYGRILEDIRADLPRHRRSHMDWGEPLFHAYTAPGDPPRGRIEQLVEDSIEALASRVRDPGLYGGIAGIGWMTAHLDNVFGEMDSSDYEQIDDTLSSYWTRPKLPFSYDLIGGIVGAGVYFLERLPDPRASDALTAIVGTLERHATRVDRGVCWHTDVALVPENQRGLAPGGYYNLGVAHGVPGVVGFLAEVVRAGLGGRTAVDLLGGAASWVLSHESPPTHFPSWITEVGSPKSTRIAWCYGELGVSIALLAAARALGDAGLESEAVRIARASAVRRDKTGVVDAGLCHGAAGNGHLYNRLYQATGDGIYQDAAVFWFEEALRLHAPGTGVGGYRALKPGRARTADGNPWEDDPTFLTGATGIALAFSAATSSVSPEWDVLLLSRI